MTKIAFSALFVAFVGIFSFSVSAHAEGYCPNGQKYTPATGSTPAMCTRHESRNQLPSGHYGMPLTLKKDDRCAGKAPGTKFEVVFEGKDGGRGVAHYVCGQRPR